MKCSVRVEAGGIEPTSRRKKERNASLSVCLFHCLSSHVLRKEEEEAQHLREVVSNACLPGCYHPGSITFATKFNYDNILLRGMCS